MDMNLDLDSSHKPYGPLEPRERQPTQPNKAY